MQAVEYLSTWYSPELQGEGGESYQYSKQSGLAIGR